VLENSFSEEQGGMPLNKTSSEGAEYYSPGRKSLLRNSKILSHIVIRCFRNHNILWFSPLKFEFRNSLVSPG